MNVPPWSLSLKIIAGTFHSVAIACTIFRLMYRWYMTYFWWEDSWAVFALVCDVVCLVATLLEQPTTAPKLPHINYITNWMVALAFPCVLWACRTSILFSIVRVANPSEQLRRVAYLVGCSFLIMWAALMVQKIQICITDACLIAGSVGLSQLITDVISDLSLVIMPIYLLRETKVNYRQRIMVFAVFSASLLITLVSILHSLALFLSRSNGIIVIGHVKAALSLIVCNLLVIVAFIYRMCHRRGGDLDATDDRNSLTSVDLNTGLTESVVQKRTATTIVHHSFMTTTETSHSEVTTRMIELEEMKNVGSKSA
ncbi:hypothetical protein OG21DRAFT_1486742 [Imleria badia]|nr:hypothetical protein OG21DRAFT_1486742 [Imleria badia]